MKHNLQIKPSKQMGVAQMIGGGIFTIIGLTVVIPMLVKAHGPVWFGLLWTGVAVAGAIMGAINAFSEKGIPTEEIVSDVADAPTPKPTEDRLRELDDLRRKELISPDEFAQTRQRILDEH